MAKIYETLRKKNDPIIEVYPNIESQNIPNGAVTETKIGTNAVTTGKLANSSVNSNKLSDGAVTTNKIGTFAVTNEKIADNSISNAKMQTDSVTTSNIVNGSVTTDKIRASAVGSTELADGSINDFKLSDNLWKWLKRIQNTYLVYVGDNEDTIYEVLTTFTADEVFNEYTEEDIRHAFDFDKNQVDYTNNDLNILSIFIESIRSTHSNGNVYDYIISNDLQIHFYKSSATTYDITLFKLSTSTILFELAFDISTHTITAYINTKYIYVGFRKLIDENANYER